MYKLFCDIDSTVNDHWKRIQRFTVNGTCDWHRAFSRDEILKDGVLPNAVESINKLSQKYEVHFLTARPFANAYEITESWLIQSGFTNYNSILIVDKSMDKLKYVTEPNCLFIDDLSRKHETNPPYTILYNDVITMLDHHNVDYELFKNNWNDIIKRRLK
tara:strand:- start:521 stop:1000 length:480 start_codon:yes stop_codon:yes gene_type:complete